MVGFLGPTAWPPGRLELTITERRPKDLMTHGFGCRPPMGQFLSCVGGGTCRGCSQCDLYPSTGGPRNLRSRQGHADEGSSRASAISLPERRKPLGGHPTHAAGGGCRLVLSWLRNVQWGLMGVPSYLSPLPPRQVNA